MNNLPLISICGDVCSECPRYIATQQNDVSKLEKLARLWFRLGFREGILPYEQLKCSGCSKDKNCGYDLIHCVNLTGKSNCGECDIFPCKKIESVFNKTYELALRCEALCSQTEFHEMDRAFFKKRDILNEIHTTSITGNQDDKKG
jgi:hypothetical protein